MTLTAGLAEPDQQYLIARQPIVGPEQKLLGYELLYRPPVANEAAPVSGDMATAQVLSTSLSETDLSELVGDCKAFVNLTRDSILNLDLLSLPTGRVVFEILEDIEIDDILLKKIKELCNKGYKFALDDFSLDGLHNDIIQYATYVKVDVLQLSNEEIAEHARILQRHDVTLIAEKVETWEDFEYCKLLGYDLFQGYFFARPQLISGKTVRHSRATTYRLITRLNDPEVGFDELEKLASQDPALSFKLFRYINSASISRNRTFSNLRQVMVLLGIDRLRMVATMFAMCQMDTKPTALARVLLHRAQLCRLLAEDKKARNADDYFTVGMFSMLDAFMDKPLEEALKTIPLPEPFIAALVEHQGPMGEALLCAIHIEQQSCQECEDCLYQGDRAIALNNAAAKWATDTVRLLDDCMR